MRNKVICLCTGVFLCLGRVRAEVAIRVGHFPNITHAQALVGLANGAFQKTLGDVKIEVRTFTAGPSEIEALFAKALDLVYIGPGPAINGFVKSGGELVVIAGACSGGASLVVRNDLPIKDPADFRGKRIASPQLGGTQDIALRRWLKEHGLAPVEKGGDVRVLPMSNADQLTLFVQKKLDGAWAPEPWAARLVVEGQGRVYLDERTRWPRRQFAATVILVRKKFLSEHPRLVEKWLAAHVDVTAWIKKNPALARALIHQEIKRITTQSLPDAVIAQAWDRLEFTADPLSSSLTRNADSAYELGFLGRRKPDLSGLVDLKPLSKVLLAKGRPPIAP
ncbi:MAG: sulfate ABC transporter substrate-binding protein [Elusimicrobia bacterium RIFCSPLOWO2_01_FULL_59_12]|nr:MAG: sulfate ABC transporter substrate-binding protein [Elusimicrobia bacterium RIFCSPLOWO2_01_FULL_59_12]